MTNKEKINRLRNIQRNTPIHTRDDIRDFETLEAAIEDIETLDWIESIYGKELEERKEESIAKNWLMAVSGMSIEELTDAFTKGYRLVSPDKANDQVPNMRVMKATIDEARIVFQMGKEEPCRDCVSRQAVLDKKELVKLEDGQSFYCISPDDVKTLPPVTPQQKTGQEPKTGHWIVDGPVDCYLDKVRCHCSECGKNKEFPADYDHIKQELSISYKNPEFIDNYCPNCGAKMQEVEE